MKAYEFYKTVVRDHTDFLERFIDVLDEQGIRFCVIGGMAVNAYVEPMVTLDLDVVIATDQFDEARAALEAAFKVREFPHTLNLSQYGSDLRIQIQLNPCFAGFAERAEVRIVLGMRLPVATLEDVLQSKIWAAQEPTRRASKQVKDLA